MINLKVQDIRRFYGENNIYYKKPCDLSYDDSYVHWLENLVAENYNRFNLNEIDLILWLKRKKFKIEKQYNEMDDTDINKKISKGAKLRAYNEVLGYVESHNNKGMARVFFNDFRIK